MPITPQDFVSKWKRVTAREKQTYREHLLDLCHLVGHQSPNELSIAEILEKLLKLNFERAKP